MPEQFSVLGKCLTRNDAIEKVKGEAKFAADVQLPGMLYASFLRSPYAHARIASIDTSRAQALPRTPRSLTSSSILLICDIT